MSFIEQQQEEIAHGYSQDSQRQELANCQTRKSSIIEIYQNQGCQCYCHTQHSHQINRQVQSMKLKQHLLQSQHNFSIQMIQNKLDESQYQKQCLQMQNTKLKDFIKKNTEQFNKLKNTLSKYQIQLKNQQILIDEYKISMEEQIQLEKQVIKSGYQERQCQLRNQFQKALRDIEDNYRRKLKQIQYSTTQKQFNQQLQIMKNFCSGKLKKKQKDRHLSQIINNKQNLVKRGTNKQFFGISSYSTVDR